MLPSSASVVDCRRAAAVRIRAYADRIVVRCQGEVVAEHPRFFGRDRTVYNPWHYLPVLVTKPGALRNGAPFQAWEPAVRARAAAAQAGGRGRSGSLLHLLL